MRENEPLKVGDDVILQQLSAEHMRHWGVEHCAILKEAARHLGIDPKTVSRQLDRQASGDPQQPRSLRQLAARGRARYLQIPAPDEAETNTDA